jgi:hypothetical protein
MECFSVHRLYAVCDGARHFLFERDEADLEALQSFIADVTGWRVGTSS